ncbi:MAG: DUF6390 family protein [Patescibacteria group bacterium]
MEYKIMTGPLFAATFSFGCEMANILGLTPLLEEYAISGGKSCSEQQIRQALKKLVSYFYYLAIAKANDISDPFDLQVVKAHWIGNELLEKVAPKHAVNIIKEEVSQDKFVLAYCLKPVIKAGKAHHNFYAKHIGKENCRVVGNGEWLWHLGQKRILVTPEDLQNLAKYG